MTGQHTSTKVAATPGVDRFVIVCLRCDRPVLSRVSWVGREVQCPHCSSVLRVPPPGPDGLAVRAQGPDLRPKRFFNFGCPRCECLLEAHTGMSGQLGSCPTCAARLSVPWLRPGSNFPEKAQLDETEVNDPTPMHLYGASGDQAPRILTDGPEPAIECPRCGGRNAIDADHCAQCSQPFTMEAAPTLRRIARDSRAVASLTLALIGLILFPTLIPGILGLLFGLTSVASPESHRRSGMAIAGVVLGLIAVGAGVAYWASR